MNSRILFLSLNFVYLNLLDLLTTIVLLSLGGRETNVLFLHFNETGVGVTDVIIKLSLTLFLSVVSLLLYLRAQKETSKLAVYLVYGLLIVMNIFYILVVVNNLVMLNFQIQEFRRVYG